MSERVCSRCGAKAGDVVWCSRCGLNLRLQGELPTREAYEAARREEQWLAAQQAAELQQADAKVTAEREEKRAHLSANQQVPRSPETKSDETGRGLSRRYRYALLAAVAAAVLIPTVVALDGGRSSHTDADIGNLDPNSPIDSGGDLTVKEQTGDTVPFSTVERTLRETLYDRAAEKPVSAVSCDPSATTLADGDRLSCKVTLTNGRIQPITATALREDGGYFAIRIDLR